METTEQLIEAFRPEAMLEAVLKQIPNKEEVVREAAKALGFVFEEDKMPLDQFWAIVAEINWGENHRTIDINKMKLRLMRKYTQEQLDQADDRVREMTSALARATRAWEKGPGREIDAYGDSWDDLLNHIVGCGREEYEAAVADPGKVAERYNSGDYWESFAYCFPWSEDYKKLTLEYYRKWAKRVHAEWEEELMGEPEALEEVLDWLHSVSLVSKAKRFRELVDEGDQIVKQIEHLDIKPEHRTFGHSTVNEHAVINLVNDARRYFFAPSVEEEGESPR
jgi:hypothetical protein